MRILEEMINSIGVKQGCPTLDAVNLVAHPKQELGQISTVLPSNPCNQGNFFCHSTISFQHVTTARTALTTQPGRFESERRASILFEIENHLLTLGALRAESSRFRTASPT